RAEREALVEQDRGLQERRRQTAFQNLLAQAQFELKRGNFQVSVQISQSALGFKQSDEAFQIMALARARAAEAERARAAEQLALREIQLRRQREAELEQARQQLERERAQREALERAQREAQGARDQ